MGGCRFPQAGVLELNQALLANLRVERNDTDAFEGTTGGGFVGMERQFLEHWSISAGPAFIYADIQRSAGEDQGDQFLLAGREPGSPMTAATTSSIPARG